MCLADRVSTGIVKAHRQLYFRIFIKDYKDLSALQIESTFDTVYETLAAF